MVNYGSKILGNASSSLTAQQALIGNISSNIANVNTPGYARRIIDLESRSARNESSFAIGNGVDIGRLRRSTSQYLDRLVQEARADFAGNKTTHEYLERIENLFPLDNSGQPIGEALDGFFGSMRELALSPASIQLRKNVIDESSNLITAIKTTYGGLAALQEETNSKIHQELSEVNEILSGIARLNSEIKGRETTGEQAVAERDNRDQLIGKLSEKISFNLVEVSDGTVNISLKGGFTIVGGGAAKSLELHPAPSFLSGTPAPPSLQGTALGYIVYDFSGGTGNGHIDLSSRLAAGDGTIGALLKLRGIHTTGDTSAFDATGIIPALAQRVEAITRTLLVQFNQEYLGPDRGTTPGVWAPSAGDLNGNTPDPFGFFSVDFSGALDSDADGYPETADLAASGLDNFSSRLMLTSTDPRTIATARDSGSGPPAAPVFPTGDSQNLDALIAIQDQTFSFSLGGSYSFEGTLNENYYETVGTVGNYVNSSRVDLAVSKANVQTAELQQAEVSGVSLNEEFSKTIQFQRNFEAAARLVQSTQELFQTVVELI